VNILTARAKVAAAFALFPLLAFSQGGPPYRSDDPDTPGNGHWEINMGFIGERNSFAGSYDLPNLDINYGVGNRIQLKYEVPLSLAETRGDSSHVLAGLGNSLMGVKYRFYQRHSKSHVTDDGEHEIKFSLSTYPQLLLNHPTNAVERGIVEPAPQFLLPLEASATYGWFRMSGEVGYWFTGKDIPDSVLFGGVIGHEFSKDVEAYAELFNQQEVGVAAGIQALHDTTFGVGGRLPIVKRHWLRLIGMGGHSLVTATPTNGQPGWIAYVGIQFLSDKRRRHGDD
jgi:hypothetical protein